MKNIYKTLLIVFFYLEGRTLGKGKVWQRVLS